MRILGIDPGLQHTGWGVVEADGAMLRYVASGTVHSKASDPLAERLAVLHAGITEAIALHSPTLAAIEDTFVNSNAKSSLKLGHARGALMMAASQAGLDVAEYTATAVKKAVLGGKADKDQVAHMVKILLPKAQPDSADASDALAVAICHTHHVQYHSATGAVQ